MSIRIGDVKPALFTTGLVLLLTGLALGTFREWWGLGVFCPATALLLPSPWIVIVWNRRDERRRANARATEPSTF